MIGKKLKARRLELGMTQDELAKKLGYRSRSTINKIELDKHDVSQTKLKKIAEVLDCPPTYFIEDVEHTEHGYDQVLKYAKMLSELPADAQDNVCQYIEFLRSHN